LGNESGGDIQIDCKDNYRKMTDILGKVLGQNQRVY